MNQSMGRLAMSCIVHFWVVGLLVASSAVASQDDGATPPSYDYEVARTHEIKPHRRVIPLAGVSSGFNQLRISLAVSAFGDVTRADAGGEASTLKFWPQIEEEVRNWKFAPFEKGGKPVSAQLEEYIDLVPPERMPKKHVAAPVVKPDSVVEITLERTGCYGSCPGYTVTVGTDGIRFNGRGYVVAAGTHSDRINPEEVRGFAKRIVAADFYSMDASYRASVTDNPTCVLTITIDGKTKEVEDYVGEWEGMPAIITELEDAVDALARTGRWINGEPGLVAVLQADKYDFHTFQAQVMLKEAASRGASAAVRELLDVGVPLDPLPAPKPAEPYMAVPFEHVGWLTAAAEHPDTLQILIDADASKDDQNDQDLALISAARSGDVAAVRALIEYGADPNADLGKATITESGAGMTMERPGAGSILHYTAESGNPEMVKAILEFHPDVNLRGAGGKTPLFAAGEYRDKDVEGARGECVRLLAEVGADVNARDDEGNTPLHETFLEE